MTLSSRPTRLASVVLLALIVVGVAIGISSSGGGTHTKASSKQAAATVQRLLSGIPQEGNRLGKPSAPVQVTVYEDLQCPICREFTLGAENQLIAGDVRAGRVKLVFRSLQTATPDATTFQAQQQAAMAAGRQNKLWYFVELFYHQQGQEGTSYVTESYLDDLAHEVPGLDYAAWLSARRSGATAAQVSADQSLARSRGFDATPTIAVQGPKSSPSPVAGAIDYGSLAGLVRQAGG